MHILGGFWVAVTSFWIYLTFIRKESVENKKEKALTIFSSVLIIGLIWEIFELISGNTFMHTSNFYTDSISDTINNFIGALVAYFYVIR